MAAHPLLAVLQNAAAGRFPPVDGAVDVLPRWRSLEAVIAFTGHAFVATALEADAIRAAGADGYGGAHDARFLTWLAGEDGWIGCLDNLLVAPGLDAPALPERSDLDDHPRVRLARNLRVDVHVYGDDRGLVIIGTGMAGRLDVSVEIPEHARSRGAGRSLITDARGLACEAGWLFASVSPGNAASLRAFLAAGFRPIGGEVLLRPAREAR
ncbi:hypothetical protein BMS3Abin02_02272 [bacterium BMS3Abin02]|nr:hypothetical protein BMS3Abin02_02272 [bacterium BMS3Abin02]HDH25685.1 hypothetical protein [Actinomycetota bacterium]